MKKYEDEVDLLARVQGCVCIFCHFFSVELLLPHAQASLALRLLRAILSSMDAGSLAPFTERGCCACRLWWGCRTEAAAELDST